MKIDLFIKGLIVGLFKIIPGLSGSLMAYNLNIYDECINKLNNLFNYNNIKYLLNVGIGILISIVLFSKIISYLYLNYCFIFMMISILLISSTTKIYFKNKLLFIITLIISLILLLSKFNINFGSDSILNTLLLGIIEAISTIVPSLSGSAIFMMLNSYDYVLSLYSSININTIYFFVGILIGLFISIKAIKIIISKYKNIFMTIISALSISTIIYLFIKNINTFNELIIGSIFLILGIKITLKHIIY